MFENHVFLILQLFVSKAYGDSTKERKRAQIAQGWPFLLLFLREHSNFTYLLISKLLTD